MLLRSILSLVLLIACLQATAQEKPADPHTTPVPVRAEGEGTIAARTVTVTELSGKETKGELVSVSSKGVELKLVDQEKPVLIPSDSIELVRFPGEAETKESPIEVILHDGTRLVGTNFSIKDPNLTLETAGESLQVSLALVRSVHKDAADPIVKAWWAKKQGAVKRDIVAIRRDKIINPISGVLGKADGDTIEFSLLDSETGQVRKKVTFLSPKCTA